MEQMGHRKGEMTNMEVDGKGPIRIEATLPSRGLSVSVLNSDHDFWYWYHDLDFSHYGPAETRYCLRTLKWCTDFYGSRYLPGLCTVHT